MLRSYNLFLSSYSFLIGHFYHKWTVRYVDTLWPRTQARLKASMLSHWHIQKMRVKLDVIFLQKTILNADALQVLTWFSGLTQGTYSYSTAPIL